MDKDLDGLLAQLDAQSMSPRLAGLEARVRQGIAIGSVAPRASWRYASVSLALAIGVWVGGASVVLQAPATTADLSGIAFAPSSLIDASS